MLIRYFDGKLRDIPDELAIAALADPAANEDISEYNSHWVNVIIHGVLGPVFDDNKNFDDNVKYAMSKFEDASDARKEQARELIRKYNIEIKDDDIGMFPAGDMI